MWEFFGELEIQHLTNEGRDMLDSPMALEELRQVVAALVNQKSPGSDGLLVEIYKKYREVQLPEL